MSMMFVPMLTRLLSLLHSLHALFSGEKKANYLKELLFLFDEILNIHLP